MVLLFRLFGVAAFVSLVSIFSSSTSSYATDAAVADDNDNDNDERFSYGTEVSWPMQHPVDDTTTGVFVVVTNNNNDVPEHRSAAKQQQQQQGRQRSRLAQLQTQQRQRYIAFMAGCAASYDRARCAQHEHDRLALNARQPARQYKNFTSTGYAVVPVPTVAYDTLVRFWSSKQQQQQQQQQGPTGAGGGEKSDQPPPAESDEWWKQQRGNNGGAQKEYWEYGSVYTNHWEAPTYHVPIDDNDDYSNLRETVVESVQTVLEKWTGTPLRPTSMYGIRVYTKGSILTPHVDRVPLVISAIVNVAQDNAATTEDWVLEVIGHDGVAVNLTVAPGEMILYESHSILHGRPYPLTGRYYANLFLHYEPVGYTQELMERLSSSTTTTTTKPRRKSNKELFQAALAKAIGTVAGDAYEKGRFDDSDNDNNQNPTKQRRIASGNNNNNQNQQQQQPPSPRVNDDDDVNSFDLPYYIVEGSKEASRWRQEFVFRRKVLPPKPSLPVMSFHQHVRIVTGNNNNNKNDTPHTIAARGELAMLIALSVKDASLMDLADRNGWKPLHEAARAGRAEIIQFLVDTHHVDVNERTNQGLGGSPLYWAEQSGDVESIKLLQSYGAKSYKPELD